MLELADSLDPVEIRTEVETRFSPENMVANYVAAYEATIASHRVKLRSAYDREIVSTRAPCAGRARRGAALPARRHGDRRPSRTTAARRARHRVHDPRRDVRDLQLPPVRDDRAGRARGRGGGGGDRAAARRAGGLALARVRHRRLGAARGARDRRSSRSWAARSRRRTTPSRTCASRRSASPPRSSRSARRATSAASPTCGRRSSSSSPATSRTSSSRCSSSTASTGGSRARPGERRSRSSGWGRRSSSSSCGGSSPVRRGVRLGLARRVLSLGKWIFIRTTALMGSFVLAGAVATRFGDARSRRTRSRSSSGSSSRSSSTRSRSRVRSSSAASSAPGEPGRRTARASA